MIPLLLLLLSTISSAPSAAGLQPDDRGFISAVVSEKGLDFAKDLLIEQGIRSLTPFRLPDIGKSMRVPFLGGVDVVATNFTLRALNVSSSTVRPGESGIVIVASGVTVGLSLDWSYFYSTWLLPIEISDRGNASIKVEGMEFGLTMSMKNKNGILELTVLQSGCYMKDLIITLSGGASWFYQGFLNAFEDDIRSTVENAIVSKITEGASKLDSLLQSLPRTINVNNVASLNVTFVDDPLYANSSVQFDINGLFTSSAKIAGPSYLHKQSDLSLSCGGTSKMLLMSLDDAVFNSGAAVYFEAGLLRWIVDRVPDQSLLNTASWKFVIPRLYWEYPNDDMLLDISLTSPPIIEITSEKIGGTIYFDMIFDVLDGTSTVPVVCISVVVTVSGVMEVSGNNLTGKAELDDFSLTLKWSKIGKIYMSLIQGVIRLFLNNIMVPYVNSHLRQGFPLPIIDGFTLEDAYVFTSNSSIVVCSNVAFSNSTAAIRMPLLLSQQTRNVVVI